MCFSLAGASMRVGLTYNLRREVGAQEGLPEDFYAECDAIETIDAVKSAILSRHEEVVMIEADESAFEKLRKERPDIVFNMAEGLWGESREAQMPAMMEMLRIPYTGSSPLALGLTLNKARAKEILSCRGVPTARFIVAANASSDVASSAKAAGLCFPMMVKPLLEGSSKGIRNDSVVHDAAALGKKAGAVMADYRQPVLIEEYLDGREFTVALLGNGAKLRCLPIVEINYSALPEGVTPIYSYEAKWIFDRPENPLDIFSCPARLEPGLKSAIETVSIGAFNALDIKDWCRIDVRLDRAGRPNVIELNPLPGILADPKENSCYPKAARAAGMDFAAMVNSVIDSARERYGI